MKTMLKVIVATLFLSFTSCSNDDVSVDNDLSVVSKKKSLDNKSQLNVQSKIYSNSEKEIMIIHDKLDEEIFFVQLSLGHSLVPIEAEEAYLNGDNQSVILTSNNVVTELSFNDDIYGIGTMSYSYAQGTNLLIEPNGTWA